MKVTNKQGLLSHTVDAISILLSHSEIFIDSQDGKADTKTSNRRISGKKFSAGNKQTNFMDHLGKKKFKGDKIEHE